MTLSKGALSWICRIMYEASEFKVRSFKTWKVRDVSSYLFYSLKSYKFGRFLSLILVNGHSRVVIVIPKNKPNAGWLSLANRIESFINRKPFMQDNGPKFPNTGSLAHQSLRREDTYKEAGGLCKIKPPPLIRELLLPVARGKEIPPGDA